MDIISFNEAATANSRIEKFIENPDSNSGVLTQPKVIEVGETVTIKSGRQAILADTVVDGDLVIEAGADVFVPAGAGFNDLDQRIDTKLDKDFSSFVDKPTPDDTDNLALQEVGGALKKVSFLNLQNVLQVVYAENKVVGSGSLTIPADGTIPQITEGNQILTCTITPKKANSRLLIEFSPSCQEVTNTSNIITVACFRNGVSDALYQTTTHIDADNLQENNITGRFIINTPSTDTLTFSLRAGIDNGAIKWNLINYNSNSMPTFTTMTITEIV